VYLYEKRIQHDGLKAYRVVRGVNQQDVEAKAAMQKAAWDEKWRRISEAQSKKMEKERLASLTFQQKGWALEQTKQAEAEMQAMGNLLTDAIELDHVVDWEKLDATSNLCNGNYVGSIQSVDHYRFDTDGIGRIWESLLQLPKFLTLPIAL
jgi:hypothetical protein